MVRDICSKYIYDKCPAVAAVGELFLSLRDLTVLILNTLHLFWEIVPGFIGLSVILSPLQVQLSSFLTTTECAVLCTGFDSKCSFNFIGFLLSLLLESAPHFANNLPPSTICSSPFSLSLKTNVCLKQVQMKLAKVTYDINELL